MSKHHTIELREALLEFCRSKNWNNPQAVTLTLRTSRPSGTVWVKLTEYEALQNLRHFLNVLHKKLAAYGFRKKAELQCLPIFEDDRVRPHLHLMLDRPECIEAAEDADLLSTNGRAHTGDTSEQTSSHVTMKTDGSTTFLSCVRRATTQLQSIGRTSLSRAYQEYKLWNATNLRQSSKGGKAPLLVTHDYC